MFEVFWGVRENMDSSLGGEECALNRIQSYGGPRRTDWELRALRTTIASGQLQVTLRGSPLQSPGFSRVLLNSQIGLISEKKSIFMCGLQCQREAEELWWTRSPWACPRTQMYRWQSALTRVVY